MVLDVGTTIAFAILTIVTFATDDTFLERWMFPSTIGGMSAETVTVGVVFYWVIPFLALAAGIVFTKWYPERARARAQTAADAAGSSG
jgi:hypothetical protein